MTHLEKIRSRGYWDLAVRPAVFEKARVDTPMRLEPILRRAHVALRGWDFPHVHNSPFDFGEDWIGQTVDWECYVEQWRVFQSGLFAFVGGFWLDWNDQTSNRRRIWVPDRPILSVRDVIYRHTELFEFAHRLSATELGGETMVVEGSLNGLAGRSLWFESGSGAAFHRPRTTQMKEWTFRREVRAGELATGARDLALEQCRQLFARFGWDASIGVLRSHQEALNRS
jgi:hypothetical protein